MTAPPSLPDLRQHPDAPLFALIGFSVAAQAATLLAPAGEAFDAALALERDVDSAINDHPALTALGIVAKLETAWASLMQLDDAPAGDARQDLVKWWVSAADRLGAEPPTAAGLVMAGVEITRVVDALSEWDWERKRVESALRDLMAFCMRNGSIADEIRRTAQAHDLLPPPKQGSEAA